jgi:hypothetical protein
MEVAPAETAEMEPRVRAMGEAPVETEPREQGMEVETLTQGMEVETLTQGMGVVLVEMAPRAREMAVALEATGPQAREMGVGLEETESLQEVVPQVPELAAPAQVLEPAEPVPVPEELELVPVARAPALEGPRPGGTPVNLRLKRDMPTITNPNNEALNELARRILTSIEAAFVANDDDGNCLRQTLCENNKFSRSVEGNNKILIPVWRYVDFSLVNLSSRWDRVG